MLVPCSRLAVTVMACFVSAKGNKYLVSNVVPSHVAIPAPAPPDTVPPPHMLRGDAQAFVPMQIQKKICPMYEFAWPYHTLLTVDDAQVRRWVAARRKKTVEETKS